MCLMSYETIFKHIFKILFPLYDTGVSSFMRLVSQVIWDFWSWVLGDICLKFDDIHVWSLMGLFSNLFWEFYSKFRRLVSEVLWDLCLKFYGTCVWSLWDLCMKFYETCVPSFMWLLSQVLWDFCPKFYETCVTTTRCHLSMEMSVTHFLSKNQCLIFCGTFWDNCLFLKVLLKPM